MRPNSQVAPVSARECEAAVEKKEKEREEARPKPKPKTRAKRKNETEEIMDSVFRRLQRLDRRQLDKIMRILDRIEGGELEASTASNKGGAEDAKQSPAQKSPRPGGAKKELVFRVLSTWGHPHMVGITEIELYDSAGNRILDVPCHVRNTGLASMQPIARLGNGQVFTNDERHMWTAYLPVPPAKFLELVYSLPCGTEVGGILIWNYNKNAQDSVKGVMDAEIIISESTVWAGRIARGNGHCSSDYATAVVLSKSPEYTFANRPQPVKEEPAHSPAGLPVVVGGRPISVPTPSWLQDERFLSRGRQKILYETPGKAGGSSKERKSVEQIGEKNATPKACKSNNSERRPRAGDHDSKRRIHNRLRESGSRDQSIERHMDNLMFFEASKRQRMGHPFPSSKQIPVRLSSKLPPSPRLISIPKEKTPIMKPTLDLVIPELPSGRILTFDILSTWGDQFYVGLSGIEVFTSSGRPVAICEKRQVSADPPDINILPEYGSDPRTADKLVDGVYLTRDDMHVWLAPYTMGARHCIRLDMGAETTIAMIRIWNYNKSRIHSYRGVRDMVISLDGLEKQIFAGEIRKAPGEVTDPRQCCEVIMFTGDETIMEKIAGNDWVAAGLEDSDPESQPLPALKDENSSARPMTVSHQLALNDILQPSAIAPPSVQEAERPHTAAVVSRQDLVLLISHCR